MAGLFVSYPSLSGSGGGGGLSSISFSIGTLDAGTINQNGASVSSNSIFLQSATATFPGLVNSASQTFGGIKTFQDRVAFQSVTSHQGISSFKNFVSIGSGFSTGVLLTISSNTAFQVAPASTNIHVIGADGADNRISMDTYNAIVGGAPGLFLRRARGTSASPTSTLQDDTLGFMGAVGYGTTAFGASTSGTLSFKAAQLWTDTNQGTYFRISLIANSTTTAISRFLLTESGVLALSAYVGQTGPLFTTGSGGSLISGSVSLTTQVSGILPAANLPPLSGITGSVSLTTQVSGLLPQSNIGSLSASYNVGAIDTATASANGAVIGTSSLYMQSASVTSPGLMNTSTTQSFTGIKNFVRLGINNTSGSAGLYAVSSGLATNTVTIQGLSGQTSLGLNLIDSAGNPKVVYDFNAGALRLFVNANEAAECNFDNRATVVTGAISSGSVARFNFVCSDQSALGAGKGGGIAFGASQTGSTTVTEFGYVWATKNNANSGDLDGTLHLASRNNASGKAQRGIDIDQLGNSVHFGQVQMAGALNGQLNLSAGSSVATYTVTLPSAQSSGSSYLRNDGLGNTTWSSTTLPGSFFYHGLYSLNSGSMWQCIGSTYADFAVVGVVSSLTQFQNSGFGIVGSTATGLPGVTVLSAPRTGVIKATAQVTMLPGTLAGQNPWALKLHESSTTTDIAFTSGVNLNNATQVTAPIFLTGYFSATAGQAYTFKVQGAIGSLTSIAISGLPTPFQNAASKYYQVSFTLDYIT